jgi:hypothetical protein
LTALFWHSVDDKINLKNGVDTAQWYFEAPPKFSGNLGIAYGGILSFNLMAFSGQFEQLNGNTVRHDTF